MTNPYSGPQTVIAAARLALEREPLRKPFGFKGGAVTELWQAVTVLESSSGARAAVPAVQSPLWSDPAVFAAHSEAGANALMLLITEYALSRITGRPFPDPPTLQEWLLEPVLEYAGRVTGRPELKKTFALNALVGPDLAAWLVWAAERGVSSFDGLLAAAGVSDRLLARHDRLALAPLVPQGATTRRIEGLLEAGAFILKLKLGHPGDRRELLRRDQALLERVHRAARGVETPHTPDRRVHYYLDPNQRYGSREDLLRLLEFADRIGALERVLLLEEPFPEHLELEVGDLPVTVAADESVQDERDARRKIAQGYRALTLKPVAKTLSRTLKVLKVAQVYGIPCLCADLTVNPLLLEWNRNLAARLPALPGLACGFLEVNGPDNYRGWERLAARHPRAGAAWTLPREGFFPLDDRFYEQSGGLFLEPAHYPELPGLGGLVPAPET